MLPRDLYLAMLVNSCLSHSNKCIRRAGLFCFDVAGEVFIFPSHHSPHKGYVLTCTTALLSSRENS